MTAIRIQVTAEDCAAAGPWPRPPADIPKGWANPVELAIARAADIDVDVDGDEVGWHATIGTSGPGSSLVVDLDDETCVLLNRYYEGEPELMAPFEFRLELDDWLVDFFRCAE